MESINILNIQAGIKEGERQQINPKYYDLFANSIAAWQNTEFNRNYFDNAVNDPKETAVNKGYSEFHKFHQIEVQKKKQDAGQKAKAGVAVAAVLVAGKGKGRA